MMAEVTLNPKSLVKTREGYIRLDSDQVSDLMNRIEKFIDRDDFNVLHGIVSKFLANESMKRQAARNTGETALGELDDEELRRRGVKMMYPIPSRFQVSFESDS